MTRLRPEDKRLTPSGKKKKALQTERAWIVPLEVERRWGDRESEVRSGQGGGGGWVGAGGGGCGGTI